MRPKLLFILVISLWGYGLSTGQTIEQTYDFAEQQYRQGNYEAALTDYQRVAFFDSGNRFTDVYLKIAHSFYNLSQYSHAIKNFDVAYRFEKTDSLKNEILFGKALCYFKEGKYLLALNELFTVPENTTPYFASKRDLFLAISYFGIEDYENALGYFCNILPPEGDSLMSNLFNDYYRFLKRFNPEKIQTMSIILPGLGQIYCGHLGSGLNSVILLGGIALVSVYIWQAYGVLDALMSMSSWYYRYYSGGYRNAKIIAIDKIAHEKEEVYNEVLKLVQNYIH